MRFYSFNHRSLCSLAIVTFAAATAATCAAAEEPSPPEPPAVSFSREVAPLVIKHCLACHNPRKAEGGYRVDCYAVVAAAGDSGLSPLLAEGDDSAELLRRIVGQRHCHGQFEDRGRASMPSRPKRSASPFWKLARKSGSNWRSCSGLVIVRGCSVSYCFLRSTQIGTPLTDVKPPARTSGSVR